MIPTNDITAEIRKTLTTIAKNSGSVGTLLKADKLITDAVVILGDALRDIDEEGTTDDCQLVSDFANVVYEMIQKWLGRALYSEYLNQQEL